MGGSMPRPGSEFFADSEDSIRHKVTILNPDTPGDELDMVSLKISTKLPDVELRRHTIFEPFNRLPYELRRIIWMLSLPSPQLIEFHVFDAPPDLPWKHVVTHNPARSIPTALHVCHESRDVALTGGTISLKMAQQIDYSVMPRLRRNNKPCKIDGLLAKDNMYRFWDPQKDAFLLRRIYPSSTLCGTRSRCYRNYTQAQVWFDPRLRHLVISEWDLILNLPAWMCRMPELKTLIIISSVWQRASLAHWRGKKAHEKANRLYIQDEEFVKERLQWVAETYGKDHLNQVNILAVEDEREAREEVQKGFPGIRDKIKDFKFIMVEGETIPRRVPW